MSWETVQTGPGVVHVVPEDDTMTHHLHQSCPCGVTLSCEVHREPTCGHLIMGHVYAHTAADGRE